MSPNMATILYKNIASPPARAVMMVIDILGIEEQFDMRDINPVYREQDTSELTRKNPMRTIPILDEGDFWLGDSHAIMLYLIDKYGRPEHSHLYPQDTRKRATINQRLFLNCGVLFPALRAIMAPTYMGRLTEISNSQRRNVETAYGMLEVYLCETLYLADDVVTLADIAAVTTVSTLHGLHAVDEKRFPKVIRWLNNMTNYDVCKRINVMGSHLHVVTLKAQMEINKEKLQGKSKL